MTTLLLITISWLFGTVAGGYRMFWRRGGTHELLLQTIADARLIANLTAQLQDAVAALDRYRDADPSAVERAARADLKPLASVTTLPATYEGAAL